MGNLKQKTCDDLAKYVKRDERLPQVLYNLQKSGAKTFLLTNSGWEYTNQVMDFLLNFPDAPYAGRPWQSYFNFTFVDARKPTFFAEGTVLRQVNKETEEPWRTLLCTVAAALRFSPSSLEQRAEMCCMWATTSLETCSSRRS